MSTEEFEARLEELEEKAASLSRDERKAAAGTLAENYVGARGVKPPSYLMERLADVILYEELSDKRPNKMQAEEYPILSEWQRLRRVEGRGIRRNKQGVRIIEVPIDSAKNVGTNGIDYTPSKRSFANPF